MQFAIFGTGGVGGYFGGRLAQAGEEVSFIARGAHLAAIREKGLRVESLAGDFVINPAKASDDPAQIGPVDVVLVATKAWQVGEAAQKMRPLLGTQTIVVPLQNGISAPDELSDALGKERVLGGLCRISAFIGGPGLIQHVGVQPYIAFGERDGTHTQRVEQLRAAFEGCQGLTAAVPDDIEAAMWDKFIFIAAISGVGAITRQPVGGFRAVPESRALLVAALDETIALARARGIHLPADQTARTLDFIDKASPTMIASMQKDILEGKPSELEAQNGAVVKLARALGLRATTHEFIYACLLPGELKARMEFEKTESKR
jgi:2-dehydropantoate 2-reductase